MSRMSRNKSHGLFGRIRNTTSPKSCLKNQMRFGDVFLGCLRITPLAR